MRNVVQYQVEGVSFRYARLMAWDVDRKTTAGDGKRSVAWSGGAVCGGGYGDGSRTGSRERRDLPIVGKFWRYNPLIVGLTVDS